MGGEALLPTPVEICVGGGRGRDHVIAPRALSSAIKYDTAPTQSLI
jgi:hypothetical protein